MPQHFGRYWLQEKIGHGGMAEIFRATIGPDPETYAFELAIKRLHAELEKDPRQVGSFLTEADVAKFLRHPNLVQVYEAGIIDGHVYIAMEYIWGFDLARLIDLLRRRRILLPPELAVYVALQILRGLDYVHQAKNARGDALDIVHRDVTPSNIYVTFRGEVKLGDFGIAKVNRPDQPEETNVLRGKVHYMPPEVIAGQPVGPSVDLFSLAVTLYEMLTGRPLREGIAEADMMAGKYELKPTPVHKLNPNVDSGLSNILQRALSPKVKNRPEDAASFYRELKTWISKSRMVVDAAALARFVRAGTNLSGAEPKSQAGDTDFNTPEYLAPIEFSPTQRYELRHPRNRFNRLWLGAPIALMIAMALGYTLARHHSRPAVATMDSSIDTEMLGDVDETTQQRFRQLAQRGAVLLKQGSYEEARGVFQQALSVRPHSATAQLGAARAAYELGDYRGAEQQTLQVIRDDPQNARAQCLLGSVLRAAGRAPQAKKAFQQCATLDPQGQFGKSAQQILNGWGASP